MKELVAIAGGTAAREPLHLLDAAVDDPQHDLHAVATDGVTDYRLAVRCVHRAGVARVFEVLHDGIGVGGHRSMLERGDRAVNERPRSFRGAS